MITGLKNKPTSVESINIAVYKRKQFQIQRTFFRFLKTYRKYLSGNNSTYSTYSSNPVMQISNLEDAEHINKKTGNQI